MKLTLFILLTACLTVSANGFSQSITLREKNASLDKVFKAIEKQSGYSFIYRDELLKTSTKVDIDVRGVSVAEALAACFAGQPLTYEIIDKTIVVKEKKTPVVQPVVSSPLLTTKGRITNEAGEPVTASVQVKGTNNGTTTNQNGEFTLKEVDENAILIITGVGIETYELKVNSRTDLGTISVKTKVKVEEDIVVNTGYQTIARERATGSFVKVDNELLNRSVSTNILDRLNGVASGVLFNSNTSAVGFSVRGRSTIFANTSPLIVLDNFAYDGDLSTINPNDIESITILKDAAAASIWGVRASNGVVVITSKKGRYGQKMQVSVNSNVTIREKLDLYGKPDMTTSDLIDVERFLFDKGAFNSTINIKYAALTPVQEILLNKRNNLISEADANAQIDALRSNNNKDDLLKYYYRKNIYQQYSVNLSGGGNNNKYYLSVGFDRNLQDFRTDNTNRLTINAANTYSLLKNKLELSAGITFTTSRIQENPATNIYTNRSYRMLADDQGNALAILPYRKSWLDTIAGGRLINWARTPLDEFRSTDNETNLTNYLLNVGLRYRVVKNFSLDVLYQYSKGIRDYNNLNSQQSFFTRDLINQYSQINYQTGNVTYPIPLGDILDMTNSSYYSHNVRGQVNYTNTWNADHNLMAIAGAEMKDFNNTIDRNRLYGYNQDLGTVLPVDYVNRYAVITTGSSSNLPFNVSQSGSTDRYLSYFANAAYVYKGRYTLSASARKDESNLFGVKANQKGVPLWSVGAAWNIAKERFFHFDWISDLRLRLTNGYNGNVDKTVSAFTTAESSSVNQFQANTAVIVNPPNPSLRWEKINITNIGLDFGLLNNRISGSLEYYFKRGIDIIGNSPLAPSTGVTEFRGNSADIKGRGMDVVINSLNIDKGIKWNTGLLFSYNTDEITKYKVKTSPLDFHEGRPYSGIYSYRWAGLDPLTGDPQGFLNGQVSKAWATIRNIDSSSSVVYNGPGIPVIFGSLRNTIAWKGFSFSFNITYKLGYYFRERSIDYSSLFTLQGQGHTDYTQRWQKAGDENKTSVPSMLYPANSSRDFFYTNSEVLVAKGDHIRLQDVQLSYDLSKHQFQSLPFTNVRVYVYANNLGILWRDNKKGIDPDYQNLPAQKSISIGVKIDF